MADNLNISTSVFDELLQTVMVLGIDKTIKTLQEAKNNLIVLHDNKMEFIIDTVSSITSVSKERILRGNDRKNHDRKIATIASVYFIKIECNYSFSEIKLIFNKDESQLSRYCSYVESLSPKPKNEFDKKLNDLVKKVKLLLIRKN